MALNFAEVANKKIEDIERPPLPPVGTYLWLITKVPEQSTLPGDLWDVVDFQLKAVAPTEDVDMSSYAGEVGKIQTRHRFMFDKNDPVAFEKNLFQLRRFLEDHVKCATPDMSLKEAMNASVNHQVLASIVWKADKQDVELFHANIGKTAPVS